MVKKTRIKTLKQSTFYFPLNVTQITHMSHVHKPTTPQVHKYENYSQEIINYTNHVIKRLR